MNKAQTKDRILNSPWTPATIGAAVGAGSATVGLLSAAAVSTYFARKVVVPPKRPVEDLRLISVGYDSIELTSHQQPSSVRLPATEATLAPGEYGLFFNGGQGFAVVGEITAYSPQEQTVTRKILNVVSGDLATAQRGRLSGVVSRTPEAAGYSCEDISLELAVGSAPAWLVHPDARLPESEFSPDVSPTVQTGSRTWAIMVHGMGATRAETLRALETTQALGMTSLHMSYRNDREAPPSVDNRYGLGFTEWADVDIAIDYAREHGAQDVVLFGWSMGGAICLQTMRRARNRHLIRAMVLDGPAADWLDLMQYHTRINKIPLRLGALGVSMISQPALNIFTGLQEPIEMDTLSWTKHAGDITVPTLILHSMDDAFVPAYSSQKLAERSPLVDFVPFEGATHTREWNVDPRRWFDAVTSWLPAHLS